MDELCLRLNAATLVGRLNDDYDFHVPAAYFPPPNIVTPETSPHLSSADDGPTNQDGGDGNPSDSSAAAGAAAAGASDIDGDKVGKSAKTIKVEFACTDTAITHLQKEQSLLNEIDLLYPKINGRTKVSMVISKCDKDVKGIAIRYVMLLACHLPP